MRLNISSPVCQTSYGLVGLNLTASLLRLGHEVSLFPIGGVGIPEGFEQAAQTGLALQNQADLNAPGICIKEVLLPAECKSRTQRCIYTIFELDRFTSDQVKHLQSYDRVFVCSKWAQNVLLQHGIPQEKTGVVRLGVDPTIFSPNLYPQQTAPETIFLQIGKFELRKGHDFLAEAFSLAFEPGDPVRLIVHGWNHMHGEEYNRFWIDLYKATKMGAQITIFEKPFASHNEIARVMAQADCGIFPSRAEGWNLELLEMMALGKHVIATEYSGHTEFASNENSLLIPITHLQDANDGVVFQGQGKWAEMGVQQLEHLVHYMRQVHSFKQSGRLQPNFAGIETAKKLTWDNAARQLVALVSNSTRQ